MNILIIDDEENINKIMSDIIKDEGYNAYTARNWKGASEILHKTGIDIVFLDVWLPQVGGIEILKIIRKKYPGTEVIMISGHGTVDTAVQSMKLGAYDFIEKPLASDRVLTVLKHAIERQKLELENAQLRKELKQKQP